MPFLNNNNKLNSNMPQRGPGGFGTNKPTAPKPDSLLFNNKSQVSRVQIKKLFKDSSILKEAEKSHLLKSSSKYGVVARNQLGELEKMFPGKFGGFIDHAEAQRTAKELYWNIKHLEKDSKNWEKVIVEKNKLNFLKKITEIIKPAPQIKTGLRNFAGSPALERSVRENLPDINQQTSADALPGSKGVLGGTKSGAGQVDEKGERIFPFATRTYDPGKPMPSAKEQSFLRPGEVGAKGKSAVPEFRPKPKLSELKFQEKWKIKEVLDKAREHGLLHPPLASGALSPGEVQEYEILELEKMFPRNFGGFIDKIKANEMIEELSWKIRNMESEPKSWDKMNLEKNKLKFLQDLGNIKK